MSVPCLSVANIVYLFKLTIKCNKNNEKDAFFIQKQSINFANMKLKICFLFLFHLLGGGLQLAGQSCPAALNHFLQSESVKHAAVSLEMMDLSTGKIIVSHQADLSLTPASTMKIVTTATALEVLGGRFSYQTSLFYDGQIENEVLKGNLYIEGSGDPTLGSEFIEKAKESFLDDWLSAIRKAGIKRIEGSIVVLDQLFGYEGISPKWLWEDLGNYYAPGSYGVSIFDNMYRVYLQSFAPGTPTAILYTEPDMKDLQWTNTVKAALSPADESYISGTPFSNHRLLYGTIPANRSSFPVKGDIPDPGGFLANYFRNYLRRRRMEVSGEATTFRLLSKEAGVKQDLTLVRSPDLRSIVRIINVRSNNHYAEHLYKLLTIKERVDIPAYWQARGLDSTALMMYDGCGLAPANAISAGFLVQILEYMYKKERAGDFYLSLPLAGKEGTVASFLKGSSLEGKAHLKSGSITGVQSYAGYIEKSGKCYAVAIIINHFSGKRADLRKEIEKLLLGLG
jgi:D-alanyl-D-alanine carboxypeptidase/D-alanyl-D-alanine-endopeptidase (penicillin-binding protein 4)